jgi:transposase
MTELPRINGREHPADFFNWIASAYVTALDANESPTRSIARLWDVSDSTARRWIRQAREQGAIRQAKKIGRRPK